MTEWNTLLQPDKGQSARPIHLVDVDSYEDWLKSQTAATRAMLLAQGFKGKAGETALLPATDKDGEEWGAVAAVKSAADLGAWCLAPAAAKLPGGAYRSANIHAGDAALGWMLSHYQFDRYLTEKEAKVPRILLTSPTQSYDAQRAETEATALVRDLVNTPAEDMGPEVLEAQCTSLAQSFDAKLTITRGDALEKGFPLIHAVGRAAARSHAPRLIELHWGKADAPPIAIIGKGVVFDTGGLDLKPSAGMRLMKKDMGGAAHAIALARLIMAAKLPVRLHLLIPAVENSVAGNAFRPGDVIKSRQGMTVEIDNTDAEGRLILADALTRAGEEKPELMVNFATLTGAARVALGPDLPAMFSNDDAMAADLLQAGVACDDAVWRMPLHAGYADMLKSDIADIVNSGGAGMAGAISAALFLQKFVADDIAWAHLDTFAWRAAPKSGRPKGGEALGLRAVWLMLQGRYSV